MLNTERLKNLRKETNYKQIDVANILGVGRTTYAKYESGDIQPPNDQITKLANLFKISSDYLLNLSDDPTPSNKKAPPKSIPDMQWGNFGISFCGTPTEEDKEMIIDSINFAMEQRRKRQEAKEKARQDKK